MLATGAIAAAGPDFEAAGPDFEAARPDKGNKSTKMMAGWLAGRKFGFVVFKML